MELSGKLTFGSYEAALRMVGVATEPNRGHSSQCSALQPYAALIRDPNPSYWDADFAAKTWGGLLAPPALPMGRLIPPPWLPTGERRVASIALGNDAGRLDLCPATPW
jgi:hypothetical protein